VNAELAAVADRLRRSTVQVTESRSGGGSGVIWGADGLIVTNAHVVARGGRMRVELHDGRTFDARVSAADARRDIAALAINASGLPVAQIRDSSTLRVGELALTVGNPLGLVGAVTSGIIHDAGNGGNGSRARWITADLRIAPGNSGGPLADAAGRVIGINSMIYGGLAVAVPSAAIERFLRSGSSRARLGVTTGPVAIRLRGDSPTLGLMIYEVTPGAAAEEGGALPGDVIVGIAGAPIKSPDAVHEAVHEARPGDVLALDILRAGSTVRHTFHLQAEGRGVAAA
jgi:serine protease Do